MESLLSKVLPEFAIVVDSSHMEGLENRKGNEETILSSFSTHLSFRVLVTPALYLFASVYST